MTHNSSVFIIILFWNRLNETIECLESVFKSDYSNFQIVVVENTSDEQQRRTLHNIFPDIEYVRSDKNLGFTGGNNLGCELAISKGADYLFLLNNDATIHPDTISKLVHYAENHEHVGLISPIVKTGSNYDPNLYLGTYIDLESITKNNIQNFQELEEIEKAEPGKICIWGTALFFSSDLAAKIGFLDNRYFAYYEDMDLSIKSIQAGYLNRIVPDAKIDHKQKPDHRVDYPEHYHFYMTRNEYLFWTTFLAPEQKEIFTRKYLAKTLNRVGGYKNINNNISAHAVLDGLWCALRNKYGARKETDKMPDLLAKLFLWHPYFWVRLFAQKNTNVK